MIKRVVAVGSVLVGVTAALAGCGSRSAPSPDRVVETAYSSTVAARTAHFDISESIRAPSAPSGHQSVSVTGSGVVDFGSKSMVMTFQAPQIGSLHMVMTGPDMYLQLPAAAQAEIPGHKAWLEINLDRVTQAKLGASYQQLTAQGSNNPAALLGQLEAVSGQVTKVGTGRVAGVATTEYAATVEFSKLEALARARGGAAAAQAEARAAQELHTSTLPVKVWVDGSNRVRQYVTTIPLPVGATGDPGSATMTMTFDNYGVPVDATPPPPSQVADITEQLIGGTIGRPGSPG